MHLVAQGNGESEFSTSKPRVLIIMSCAKEAHDFHSRACVDSSTLIKKPPTDKALPTNLTQGPKFRCGSSATLAVSPIVRWTAARPCSALSLFWTFDMLHRDRRPYDPMDALCFGSGVWVGGDAICLEFCLHI